MRQVLSLSLCVLLASCGLTYHPPSTTTPGITQEFSASFDVVWEGAVRAFAERNIQIKTLDKGSGILVSNTHTAWVDQHLECEASPSGTAQGTFNLFLRGSGASTSVQINSRWTSTAIERDHYGRITLVQPMMCVSNGVLELEILRALRRFTHTPSPLPATTAARANEWLIGNWSSPGGHARLTFREKEAEIGWDWEAQGGVTGGVRYAASGNAVVNGTQVTLKGWYTAGDAVTHGRPIRFDLSWDQDALIGRRVGAQNVRWIVTFVKVEPKGQ